MANNITPISDLVGKTFINIREGTDSIIFECSDNTSYIMQHKQDCCESVYIESITGDLLDLIGREILVAEERISTEKLEGRPDNLDEWDNSFTWTFYTLRNIKASCDIRWLGSSNGYYSESVELYRI